MFIKGITLICLLILIRNDVEVFVTIFFFMVRIWAIVVEVLDFFLFFFDVVVVVYQLIFVFYLCVGSVFCLCVGSPSAPLLKI